jgi:hypothetical protein
MLQGRFGFTYQVSAEFKARCRLRCGLGQPEHTAATDDAAAKASAKLAFAAFPHGKTRPFKPACFFDAASSQRALRAPKPDSAPR